MGKLAFTTKGMRTMRKPFIFTCLLILLSCNNQHRAKGVDISNEDKNREGFVIIFDDEFRLKLKYQEYWVLHYLKAGLSRRKILIAYCEGRSDEILKSLEILDEEHKIYYHKNYI